MPLKLKETNISCENSLHLMLKCPYFFSFKEVKFSGYHTYWAQAETKGYSGVGWVSMISLHTVHVQCRNISNSRSLTWSSIIIGTVFSERMQSFCFLCWPTILALNICNRAFSSVYCVTNCDGLTNRKVLSCALVVMTHFQNPWQVTFCSYIRLCMFNMWCYCICFVSGNIHTPAT